jgi:sulfur carrier protein ThiS
MSDTPNTETNTNARTHTVTLTYRRQTFTVKPGMTVRAAMLKCDLNPETTLATRDGELITDEVLLRPGDQIKLIATISGG